MSRCWLSKSGYHDRNRETFQRIETGDTVELRTIEPDTIALTHSGLFSIQEALTIACNASAAADVMKLQPLLPHYVVSSPRLFCTCHTHICTSFCSALPACASDDI
jgi:hypothetical protein